LIRDDDLGKGFIAAQNDVAAHLTDKAESDLFKGALGKQALR
jgi:hypothetical protein